MHTYPLSSQQIKVLSKIVDALHDNIVNKVSMGDSLVLKIAVRKILNNGYYLEKDVDILNVLLSEYKKRHTK